MLLIAFDWLLLRKLLPTVTEWLKKKQQMCLGFFEVKFFKISTIFQIFNIFLKFKIFLIKFLLPNLNNANDKQF